MSAYFLYIQANRDVVQKELGVKAFGLVTKTLSVRWKSLGAPELAKYQNQASEAKAKYEAELAAFQAAGGVKGAKRKEKNEEEQVKAAKKAKKEPNVALGKPKKPSGGAYGCYMAHHRSEIAASLPGSNVTAVSKLGGNRWKALDAKEKEKYEVEYEARKKKYFEEIKAWKAVNNGGNDDDDATVGGA